MSCELRISITGDELKERISGRIRERTRRADALDVRIKARDGDQPYDIRAGDGLETLGELVVERDRHRRRISELSLFHDRVDQGNTFILGLEDLCALDLVAGRKNRTTTEPQSTIVVPHNPPIDGLKVTMTAHQIRTALEERIAIHERRAAHWHHQANRPIESQTDDDPLLPEHMCQNEEEAEKWRIEVLTFIHDHLEPHASYRLTREDLEVGELLPEKPGWMKRDEYERETAVGFHLERLVKEVGGGFCHRYGYIPSGPDGDEDSAIGDE